MYVACSKCDKTIPISEAHRFQKKKGEDDYYCPDCQRLTEELFRQETENPNYAGAVAAGVLAGIAGGALWYFVEILLKLRVGYIGLAVGFAVGWGVILGAGKKRGETLQVISAIISLVAVLGASYLSAMHQYHSYISKLAGEGGQISNLTISPFSQELLASFVTPVGVFIWALAVYIGYRTPQARKL